MREKRPYGVISEEILNNTSNSSDVQQTIDSLKTSLSEEKANNELLKNLCSFLARHQDEVHRNIYKSFEKKTYEDMRDQLVFFTPIIQGTKNQMKLQKVGELEYSLEKVGEAVDYMLAQHSREVTE